MVIQAWREGIVSWNTSIGCCIVLGRLTGSPIPILIKEIVYLCGLLKLRGTSISGHLSLEHRFRVDRLGLGFGLESGLVDCHLLDILRLPGKHELFTKQVLFSLLHWLLDTASCSCLRFITFFEFLDSIGVSQSIQ